MGSRFWYLILLAGINFIEVCIMADKRAGKITTNGDVAEWSSERLIEFQDCICNDKSKTCTINVNCGLHRKCNVANTKQVMFGSGSPVHTNMYMYACDYNTNWWDEIWGYIPCHRQVVSDSRGQRTKTNITNAYSIQCSTHCLDVIMHDMTFTFDENTTIQFFKLGLCMTSNNTIVSSTQLTTGNIDDKKDDNTSLITGVVVGTAAAVVIAVCAVVALLWRKRCTHSENTSKENNVLSHEAIPFRELPSDTVSNSRVDNPVYGFQKSTNMENPEKFSDMNIYYLPDSPVEINTSSKRVDGYTDNNGPSYTYVDKVNMGRISNKENGAGNDISSYVNSVADSRDNTQGSNKEAAYSFVDIPETTKNTVYTHLGERTMEKTNPYDALGQTESMTVRGQSNDYENHIVVSHMST